MAIRLAWAWAGGGGGTGKTNYEGGIWAFVRAPPMQTMLTHSLRGRCHNHNMLSAKQYYYTYNNEETHEPVIGCTFGLTQA